MNSKNTHPAITTFVTLLAVMAFGCTQKSDLKPLEYLGQKAGEEAARLLKNQGSVVAVWERFEGMPNPSVEAQVKGFKTAVTRTKGLTLKESKEFVRPMSDDPRLWPAGQAARFVSMAAGADAAVLFVSLPASLAKEDLDALKGSQTKFIIVGGNSPILNALIEQKAVQAAIVNRIPPKPAGGGTETPVQWFDRAYTVVKPM